MQTTTRQTTLTPAQRTRKITAAQKRLREALALLDEVGRDFRDRPGTTTLTERETWRAVVGAASDAERAANSLDL